MARRAGRARSAQRARVPPTTGGPVIACTVADGRCSRGAGEAADACSRWRQAGHCPPPPPPAPARARCERPRPQMPNQTRAVGLPSPASRCARDRRLPPPRRHCLCEALANRSSPPRGLEHWTAALPARLLHNGVPVPPSHLSLCCCQCRPDVHAGEQSGPRGRGVLSPNSTRHMDNGRLVRSTDHASANHGCGRAGKGCDEHAASMGEDVGLLLRRQARPADEKGQALCQSTNARHSKRKESLYPELKLADF